MGLFVCDDFLADLRNHGDNGFAKRALSKILSPNGSFRSDDDDHRYHGIDDAWIRVISRGNTAWRAIYLRRGADIYLYRAGEHDIEDNLAPPARALEFVPVQSALERPNQPTWRAAAVDRDAERDRFYQNTRGRLLRTFILGRRLIPHKEVILISPFLSLSALQRTHRLGGTFDDLIEEGATVTLITKPPTTMEETRPFAEMEERGFKLAFHERLHAKLYLFELTDDASERTGQPLSNVALLGSANLTEPGFGLNDCPLEELCYELPPNDFDRAVEFAAQVVHDSDDLRLVRAKLSRGARGQ